MPPERFIANLYSVEVCLSACQSTTSMVGRLSYLTTRRILHIDLNKSNQSIILDLSEKTRQWLKKTYEVEGTDIRLSRVKRALCGDEPAYPNMAKIKGWLCKVRGFLKGCVVKCGCTPTKNKNKLYFELHRDIVL